MREELDVDCDGNLALESITYANHQFDLGYDDDGLLTMAGAWEIYRNDPATGLPNSTGLAEWITDGTLTITPDYVAPGKALMDGAVYGVDYDINSTSVASWDVTRNGLGQIDSKTETVDGSSVSYAYTYDAGGRLDTVVKDSVLVEDYSYDSQGRRIGDIDGRVYNYDDEDHLTEVDDGSQTTWYSYDVDGFLTTKDVDLDGDLVVDETTSYVYGARGELISVTLPDATTIEYINAPNGQRIAKLVDGVVIEKYLWSGLTTLLAVFDGSDNLMRRYEYAGGRLPVAFSDGTNTYYLHYDQVGSLRAIADVQGTIQKEIVYDSFGNILSDSAPTFDMDLGFAGGLQDSDAGLVRFGYRDYDAEVGRWSAKDPIGFGGGDTDLYGYARNEPVRHMDPSGRMDIIGPGVFFDAGDGPLNAQQRANISKALALAQSAFSDNPLLAAVASELCFDFKDALKSNMPSFYYHATTARGPNNQVGQTRNEYKVDIWAAALNADPTQGNLLLVRTIVHELGHVAFTNAEKRCGNSRPTFNRIAQYLRSQLPGTTIANDGDIGGYTFDYAYWLGNY